jgi:hypothetical protein
MPFISSLTLGRFGGSKIIDRFPTWTTGAGTLGESFDRGRGRAYSVQAADPDGTAIRYVVSSGSLPPGMSLDPVTGQITGTATAVTSDTVYTFTIRPFSGIFQS